MITDLDTAQKLQISGGVKLSCDSEQQSKHMDFVYRCIGRISTWLHSNRIRPRIPVAEGVVCVCEEDVNETV